MEKVIWAYYNKKDLLQIEKLFSNNGAFFVDRNKKAVEDLPFLSKELPQFSICLGNSICIEYTPCLESNGYLQCGSFRLVNDKIDSLKLFSLLKKHIRKNFTYSQRNACYYGADFYNDWLANKWYCKLPVSLESQEVDFDIKDIDNIFQNVTDLGFIIRPNYVKLSRMDEISISHDAFVICSDLCEVSRKIIRKRSVCYESDSLCIFVYINTKKGRVSFLLDKRITEQTAPKIWNLFETLKADKRLKNGGQGDGSPVPADKS